MTAGSNYVILDQGQCCIFQKTSMRIHQEGVLLEPNLLKGWHQKLMDSKDISAWSQ